jgi:hypothetical protein
MLDSEDVINLFFLMDVRIFLYPLFIVKLKVYVVFILVEKSKKLNLVLIS